MDPTPGPSQIVKVEQIDSSMEINIDENMVIDTDIMTLNSENIQFEYYDVKGDDEVVVKNSNTADEEARLLRKEYTLLSEKFSVLHSQVQNQSKLIEFLVRLDMVKFADEPDRKEMDDLQRKIALCSNLIEECTIKYNELCNEKRRILLATPNEPEKKAAIWDHFTIIADSEGQRNAECNYCGRAFNYKNLTANKCREHIFERCDKAPEMVRSANKARNDPHLKSKYSVWNFFITNENSGKTIITCIYCGIQYSSRNATKCREHLAFKCLKIDNDVREQMKATFSQEYINSFNSQKRSTIWEHYNIIEDDDKIVIQCIYCCMNYANKNATKCREHLLERCDKIPIAIRHRINNSFFESPLKTWTQIKVPIWTHFSIIPLSDRKQYKCNYCEKIYSSKNVTKFRTHLLLKCQQISDDVRSTLSCEVTRSSMKEINQDDFANDDLKETQVMDEENDEAMEEMPDPNEEDEEEEVELEIVNNKQAELQELEQPDMTQDSIEKESRS